MAFANIDWKFIQDCCDEVARAFEVPVEFLGKADKCPHMIFRIQFHFDD